MLLPWRLPRPPLWATCTMRLVCAILAAAVLPTTPCSGLLGCFLSSEALLLPSLAFLLPLPLKHHLWVQALVLRSALGRMRRLGALRAGMPRCAGECARFVRCARLALLAVAPGSPEHLPLPEPAGSCLMVQLWVVPMIGYFLPTALLAAAAQFQRQQAQQVAAQAPPLGSAHSATLSPTRRLRQGKRLKNAAAAAAAACQRGNVTDEAPAERAEHEASTDAMLCALLPAGIDASDVSGASSPETVPSLRLAPAGAARRGWYEPDAPRHQAPLQLAATLLYWLTLLLPVGAVVWATIEVAILLLGPAGLPQ